MNDASSRRLFARLLAGTAGVLLLALPAHGRRTWEVSDVAGLNGVMTQLMPADEIVLAPGVYNLTRELSFNVPYVTIRGATGVREDVVLSGPGMNTYVQGLSEAIVANTDYITIRDLTIEEWYYHAVHIRGEYDVDNTAIINVRTRNIGERHVKGSTSVLKGYISDDVLIERLYMEQTKEREGSWNDNYIGGIDAMGISGWTVRDSVAVGIRGATGGGRGAIFLWNGATDLTVQRNVFIDCDLAIAFGNPYNPNEWHHTDGGIIRNNFIVNTTRGRALELCYNKDLKIYNNSIYVGDAAEYDEAVYFYDRSFAPLTNVELANNIIRGEILDWSSGGWTSTNDIIGTGVPQDWFADLVGGDLHLTELAAVAIDAGVPLAEVTTDYDGIPRELLPDIGADERVSYLPGDANCDGVVDGADYTLWADHYGRSGLWPDGVGNYERLWTEGDWNCDRVVDGADFTLWADNYLPAAGKQAGGYGTGSAPIPEPATMLLLALGALGLIRRRPE